MTVFQAIVMAVLQGVTELFPISSLGHAVIVPALLRWGLDQNDEGFLPFLAVMHLGTAFALLVYFWRDWLRLGWSLVRLGDPACEADRRLFWRVVVATVPAVIVGLIFERVLRRGFASPTLAAVLLVANGLMLFTAGRIKRAAIRPLDQMRWREAVVIGLWQCLALLPGISRSGATMAGGYLTGLDHEDAARFSFLTATPIILGGAALEGPKLLRHGGDFGPMAILAGVIAGVTAVISVAVLMRWFRSNNARGFDPFAIYCWIAGAGSLAWLLYR